MKLLSLRVDTSEQSFSLILIVTWFDSKISSIGRQICKSGGFS